MREVPEGFNSHKEYYDYLKKEVKNASVGDYETYGTPEYERYRDLKRKLSMAYYDVEDEKKEAKKAEIESRAKENGLGPKEQKVLDTVTKLKDRVPKQLEKAKKSGELTDKEFEVVEQYVNDTLYFCDKLWEEILKAQEEGFTCEKAYRRLRKEGDFVDFFNSDALRNYDMKYNLSGNDSLYWKFTVTSLDNTISSLRDNLSKRAEARDMDTRNSMRGEKKEKKEQQYSRIRFEFYKVKTGDTPAIQLFLDDWEKEYREYYNSNENYNECLEKIEEYKEKVKEYEEQYGRWSRATDIAKSNLSSQYAEMHVFNTLRKNPKVFDSMVEGTRNNLEAKFINSVYKYSGDIKDVQLRFGISGELNGYVEGDDGKKWSVRTIIASGPIQTRHFRTLVHEVR